MSVHSDCLVIKKKENAFGQQLRPTCMQNPLIIIIKDSSDFKLIHIRFLDKCIPCSMISTRLQGRQEDSDLRYSIELFQHDFYWRVTARVAQMYGPVQLSTDRNFLVKFSKIRNNKSEMCKIFRIV